MRISVRGKNIEVTEALRLHAEKKVQKIGKFFRGGGAVDVEVELGVQRELHIAEVTVKVDGLMLRGESRTSDMYASIDAAVDRIERQFNKYKTKILRRLQGTPRLSTERPAEPEEEEEKAPVVVRSKRFGVKPMDVEEAITQMELLGHDFFVFHNAATQQFNVVYKRRDGNYGLIEPD
ncbi:MAG TPA: ribosome-associated translation inhibitor RaiA [Firmicutes bacterium]|nr:ribosome-associated translation inhibitor RaiA [Bacillota bacterium]